MPKAWLTILFDLFQYDTFNKDISGIRDFYLDSSSSPYIIHKTP